MDQERTQEERIADLYVLMDRMNRTCDTVRALGTSKITRAVIEDAITTLKASWTDYNRIDKAIRRATTDRTDDYFVQNVYDDGENIYILQISTLLTWLETLTSTKKTTTSDSLPPTHCSSSVTIPVKPTSTTDPRSSLAIAPLRSSTSNAREPSPVDRSLPIDLPPRASSSDHLRTTSVNPRSSTDAFQLTPSESLPSDEIIQPCSMPVDSHSKQTSVDPCPVNLDDRRPSGDLQRSASIDHSSSTVALRSTVSEPSCSNLSVLSTSIETRRPTLVEPQCDRSPSIESHASTLTGRPSPIESPCLTSVGQPASADALQVTTSESLHSHLSAQPRSTLSDRTRPLKAQCLRSSSIDSSSVEQVRPSSVDPTSPTDTLRSTSSVSRRSDSVVRPCSTESRHPHSLTTECNQSTMIDPHTSTVVGRPSSVDTLQSAPNDRRVPTATFRSPTPNLCPLNSIQRRAECIDATSATANHPGNASARAQALTNQSQHADPSEDRHTEELLTGLLVPRSIHVNRSSPSETQQLSKIEPLRSSTGDAHQPSHVHRNQPIDLSRSCAANISTNTFWSTTPELPCSNVLNEPRSTELHRTTFLDLQCDRISSIDSRQVELVDPSFPVDVLRATFVDRSISTVTLRSTSREPLRSNVDIQPHSTESHRPTSLDSQHDRTSSTDPYEVERIDSSSQIESLRSTSVDRSTSTLVPRSISPEFQQADLVSRHCSIETLRSILREPQCDRSLVTDAFRSTSSEALVSDKIIQLCSMPVESHSERTSVDPCSSNLGDQRSSADPQRSPYMERSSSTVALQPTSSESLRSDPSVLPLSIETRRLNLLESPCDRSPSIDSRASTLAGRPPPIEPPYLTSVDQPASTDALQVIISEPLHSELSTQPRSTLSDRTRPLKAHCQRSSAIDSSPVEQLRPSSGDPTSSTDTLRSTSSGSRRSDSVARPCSTGSRQPLSLTAQYDQSAMIDTHPSTVVGRHSSVDSLQSAPDDRRIPTATLRSPTSEHPRSTFDVRPHSIEARRPILPEPQDDHSTATIDLLSTRIVDQSSFAGQRPPTLVDQPDMTDIIRSTLPTFPQSNITERVAHVNFRTSTPGDRSPLADHAQPIHDRSRPIEPRRSISLLPPRGKLVDSTTSIDSSSTLTRELSISTGTHQSSFLDTGQDHRSLIRFLLSESSRSSHLNPSIDVHGLTNHDDRISLVVRVRDSADDSHQSTLVGQITSVPHARVILIEQTDSTDDPRSICCNIRSSIHADPPSWIIINTIRLILHKRDPLIERSPSTHCEQPWVNSSCQILVEPRRRSLMAPLTPKLVDRTSVNDFRRSKHCDRLASLESHTPTLCERFYSTNNPRLPLVNRTRPIGILRSYLSGRSTSIAPLRVTLVDRSPIALRDRNSSHRPLAIDQLRSTLSDRGSFDRPKSTDSRRSTQVEIISSGTLCLQPSLPVLYDRRSSVQTL